MARVSIHPPLSGRDNDLWTFAERMEQDILTARRRALWRPFMRAVREYGLLNAGDRVAVCISGGKDSMLLAVLMRLLRAHSDVPFEVVNLAMDPGYSPENRQQIELNAQKLGLECAFVDSDVFEAAASTGAKACFMCARMRRGCLYRHAEALHCNKVALGHHYDDAIETALMGMLYGGQMQGMRPRLRAKHFAGMQLIRPMYRIRERDIIDWRDSYGLQFLQCACRVSRGEVDSKRQSVKRLIASLEADDPKIPKNIFNSLHTVQLDSLLGWKHLGTAHTFLEDFDTCFNPPAPFGAGHAGHMGL